MKKFKIFVLFLLVISSFSLITACKNKEYTLSFESNGGTIVEQIKISGKDFSMPNDPQRDGYNFGGWFVSSDFSKEFNKNEVKSDLKLYAKWSPKDYLVSFYDNGTLLFSQTLSYGSIVTPPTVTKDHYSLQKWDIQIDHTTQQITYTSVWKINSYSVRFFDGEELLSSQQIQYGESATAPKITKIGHKLSWDKNFSFIEKNLDIFATWQKEKYNVKFVVGGETKKQEEVEYGDKATAPDMEKEGYSFSWDKDFSSVKSDLTVNGSYQLINYNVELYLNNELYSTLITNIEEDYLIDLSNIQISNLYIENWYYESTFTNKYKTSDKFKENKKLYAKTYEVNESKFSYTVDSGKAIITNFLGETDTYVVIPEELNTFPVTKIGDNAFKNKSMLKEVIFNKRLEELGNNAFFGCSTIKTVVLPSSVVSLGNGCFSGCTLLEKINLPSQAIKIGESAFSDCVNLKTINSDISGECNILNIEKIEESTFKNCTSMISINFGDILSIGTNAFANCTNLIRINSKVDYAFNFPKSIIFLGENSLKNVGKITEITLPFVGESKDALEWKKLFGVYFGTDKNKEYIEQTYRSQNSEYTKLFNIPSTILKVTILDEEKLSCGSFSNCSFIKEININSTSKYFSIYRYAFQNCNSLEKLTLPQYIDILEGNVFTGDIPLKKLVLPKDIQTIYSGALSGLQHLEDLTLPHLGAYTSSRECSSLFAEIFGTYSASFYSENDYSHFRDYLDEAEARYPNNVVCDIKATYNSAIKQKLIEVKICYVPQTLKEVTVTKSFGGSEFFNMKMIKRINYLENCGINRKNFNWSLDYIRCHKNVLITDLSGWEVDNKILVSKENAIINQTSKQIFYYKQTENQNNDYVSIIENDCEKYFEKTSLSGYCFSKTNSVLKTIMLFTENFEEICVGDDISLKNSTFAFYEEDIVFPISFTVIQDIDTSSEGEKEIKILYNNNEYTFNYYVSKKN